jgi:transcription initiation factor TFIIIB Brf1 subunit/transcription initiation factor TFIIB
MLRAKQLSCPNTNCLNVEPQYFIELEFRGEITCTKCGRVVHDKLPNMDEEKITYAESDKNYARTQQVDTYIDELNTSVSRRIKGSYAESDDVLVRQSKTQDSKKKSLLQAKASIAQFCEVLNVLDRVREKAKGIFKELLDQSKRKPKGANSDCMILAILYLALKQDGCARDFNDLARATKETDASKEIKRNYSKLLKGLPQRALQPSATQSSGGNNVPHELVNRYCLKLNFPKWLITIAADVAKNATPLLEGKYPSTVASASILIACQKVGYPTNEQAIAAATGSLQPSTILKSYRVLQPHSDELMPSDYLDLLPAEYKKK